MRPRLVMFMCTAVLSSAALPAATALDSPARAAAVTEVLASGSGALDVVLPADARVATTGDDGVRFTGEGRLLAVWLQPVDGVGDFLMSYRLPTFAGGRQQTYGSSPAADCTPTPSGTVPLMYDCAASGEPAAAVLRAGRYRLTVLTDGRPVEVTLRLQGLDGSARVRPTRPLASSQQQLPVLEQAGSRLVTFGGSADLGVPVDTFVVARARRSGIAQEASICRRQDSGTQPLAFGPHCPGGSSGSFDYQAGELGGAAVFASSSSWDTAGPVGLGGSFAGSDGAELDQALGVWLQQPRAG